MLPGVQRLASKCYGTSLGSQACVDHLTRCIYQHVNA